MTQRNLRYVYLLLGSFSFFLLSIEGYAQQEKITVSEGVGKPLAVNPRLLNFLDGKSYSLKRGSKLFKRNLITDEEEAVLFDSESVGFQGKPKGITLSPDGESAFIIRKTHPIFRRSVAVDGYLYTKASGKAERFANGEKISYVTFSPNGKKMAYVKDNNLFYYDISRQKPVQITRDGKENNIINGSTDWAYEEEFQFTKAFDWSPDGLYLAYYRFDESEVREFFLQRWGTSEGDPYTQPYSMKYPKAGEKNSVVDIYVYSLSDGKKVKADTGDDKEAYLIGISWAKKDVLSIQRLNRLQNNLTLLHVNPNTGASRVILEEKSDTYIDVNMCNDLTYVQDGRRFVMSSERSGYKHFYLYDAENGSLVKQLTEGRWEAGKLLGIEEQGKDITLYYMSTEVSHLERHLYSMSYSISSKRGEKKRISKERGVHSVWSIDPTFTYYVDEYSNAEQPTLAFLRELKANKIVRTFKSNKKSKQQSKNKKDGLARKKEMFSFPNAENQPLYGYYIKPPDFDPNTRYPLLIFQYSGPGGYQKVLDDRGIHFDTYHRTLVQNGYIVAVIDPRGSGGRGQAFRNVTYGQLGEKEVEDFTQAAVYFGSLPFVDKDRIGIWGWSYGGYMAAMCLLKAPGYFKMAIAVGGVYSWRLYDSIYTERHLGLPSDNPEAYEKASPITYVENLRPENKLLFIHGMQDDNVHFQHAALFEEALVEKKKQFTAVFYPNSTHALLDVREHFFELMSNYVYENL